MATDKSLLAHLRRQAEKARRFAERLGGADAIILRRYAAECERELARLLGSDRRAA